MPETNDVSAAATTPVNDQKDNKNNDDDGLTLDDGDDSVTLSCKDGSKVTIEVKFAKMSKLLETAIENSTDLTKEIPVPTVSAKTMKLVYEWMKNHHNNPPKEIEKPLRTANLRELVSEVDAKFIDLDKQTLFELILAANFLDVKGCLDLACAKVASMIKGKKPEEIRTLFGIQNDFNKPEERAVRNQNKWAEQS